MKILKPGRAKKAWIYHGMCEICGCEFECQDYETLRGKGYLYDDVDGNWCTCPNIECQKSVFVTKTDKYTENY